MIRQTHRLSPGTCISLKGIGSGTDNMKSFEKASCTGTVEDVSFIRARERIYAKTLRLLDSIMAASLALASLKRKSLAMTDAVGSATFNTSPVAN